MLSENATLKETVKIIIGEIIVLILMFLVFALLDRFDHTVVLGGILGAVSNILYFFLMCVGLNGAIGEDDKDKQKKKITLSYHLRLLMLGIGVAVGLKLDCFNSIAVVVPVLMTRPIITVAELLGRGVK